MLAVQLVRNRSRHDFSPIRIAGRMSVTADLPDQNLWLAPADPQSAGGPKFWSEVCVVAVAQPVALSEAKARHGKPLPRS